MKTIPRLEFKYSRIYDQNWKKWLSLYRKKKKTKDYPSDRKVISFIKKVEPLWRKHERRILRELSSMTNLPWKSKTIICYVVGRCRPFSDPLTIRVYKKPNDFVDVLTHELIHQLFTQEGNFKKWNGGWQYIHKNYKKESLATRIHIPLHAVHEHIFRKLFGVKRLEREIKLAQKYRDYKRAWAIVQKDGYFHIIENMRRRPQL